ncbi:hypothetical protein [Flavobacterium caseinilyticum]|uniref:Carboxypeptidase-like regulatory domain-containing protein n=1 Tax=Flavobacterium caseinilyticum TaxID=2541732 RepID=A0A4R5AVA6_9FLAO|nr:hypothetical protein [Flavobacterium caseinilyticum]TDD76375.1 hypothetical protein E0F89_09125 [Flavobacterium caseinilyticum]
MVKNYFFVSLLFFVLQSGFSQTEKLINGKVFYEQFPVEKVEVVNFISKKITITNAAGEFSILVKAGDELIFISKNHDIKKIILDQKTIDKNNLIISLILKPEELKEVVVTKMPSIKLSTDKAYEQGKLDQYAVEKAARSLKTGVYNGSIENGMDLMRIGGMILKLFIKEKEVVKETPQIEFKQLAKSSCDEKFYTETLKLKPDQIELFLQFCDADPKSKTLLENSNVLSMMDFLSTKNIEFKKL